MYNIAKLNDEQRKNIFNNYVLSYGGNLSIVEKDFWVTLMLDYLFHKSIYKDYFIFKGGTSLSKCFKIIDRFSEDIDLILKWKILTNDNPNIERSKTQQDKYNHLLNDLAADFIKNKLLPSLSKDFKDIINGDFKFEIDIDDPQTINFYYPIVNDNISFSILKHIKLEIGPLAAHSPVEETKISPFISKLNLTIFKNMETNIVTVLPQRTFWEKILILHQEANRPDEKRVPLRYSRHYYDVYKISLTKYKDIAYGNLDLLKMVKEFKNKFYPSSWANYLTAAPGTFKLIPSPKHIIELEKDFKQMKEMLNDNSINDFMELLSYIKTIEEELNQLKI